MTLSTPYLAGGRFHLNLFLVHLQKVDLPFLLLFTSPSPQDEKVELMLLFSLLQVDLMLLHLLHLHLLMVLLMVVVVVHHLMVHHVLLCKMLLLLMNGHHHFFRTHPGRRLCFHGLTTATAAAAEFVDRHDVLAQVGRLDAGIRTVVTLVILLLVVDKAHVLRQVRHVLPTLEADFPGQKSQIQTGLLAIEKI